MMSSLNATGYLGYLPAKLHKADTAPLRWLAQLQCRWQGHAKTLAWRTSEACASCDLSGTSLSDGKSELHA
eukprot:CAMPEP_0179063754 /NCGR_PEP_ID=MMETSP0796-20121207/27600_1 /TAXON_ID=73915 /ORGANISM="Pyrodinium bahamense, Strain pbaha01" /LENGTH=70 /DNA_ID=CAMNT_0020760689 /DNA_START=120 /DNA_END=329 /DNA_ORIENTATION=+